jgi:antitoxin HicB
MATTPQNKFEVRPLSAKEGGGYLVTFPDLPGCMSDGATIEEAIINAADAENEWLMASKDWDKAIGKPGRFVTRMPRWMYQGLQYNADREGISMNTLIVSMLARGLGERSVSKESKQA